MLQPRDWRCLRATHLFGNLDETLLGDAIAGAHVRDYAEARLLFRQGNTAQTFFVVLAGWVKAYRLQPDGSETVVMIFGVGDTVAEAAIFDDARYPVSAEALPGSRLLAIPARDFLSLIEREPRVAVPIIASLSRRLRMLVSDLEASRGAPTHHRLARLLHGLAPRSEGPVTLQLPFEKSLLALRLGMTPASLSRAFARLRSYGVVTRGSEVRIEAVEWLHRLVDGSGR
ncbi:cyclic nucleotide-binding domain-containing protein [Aquisalimonas lutea]|uniref:Crp/Fnr family transcriptional regulator n=1 Tax=Aquisalimonas lutea TaxID=1327750 RepID=UPI0025B4DD74|nr:cyclic nucleotide-binding domain-containing protein [Aquisalimonas lutea]MDN3519467.1 cyclic nucleotide-binding domain-containing protein [Aquisalimonas lutea]